MGILEGQKFKSPGNVIDCLENQYYFLTPSHPVVGSLMAHNIQQKTRKCHELPRKWFHFKLLTPTHPGGAVLGDTGREGGSWKGGSWEEGCRREGGRGER